MECYFRKLNLVVLGMMCEKEERLMAYRPYSKAVKYCWVQVDLMRGDHSGNCQLTVHVAHVPVHIP